MAQPEQNAPAATAESIAGGEVEDSSSRVAAETGQHTPGGLAQLTACYREISDEDDDDERCEHNIVTHIHYWSHFRTRWQIIEATWSPFSSINSDSSSSTSSFLCGPASGPEDDEGFSQPAPIKSRDEVLMEVRLAVVFLCPRWTQTTTVSGEYRWHNSALHISGV